MHRLGQPDPADPARSAGVGRCGRATRRRPPGRTAHSPPPLPLNKQPRPVPAIFHRLASRQHEPGRARPQRCGPQRAHPHLGFYPPACALVQSLIIRFFPWGPRTRHTSCHLFSPCLWPPQPQAAAARVRSSGWARPVAVRSERAPRRRLVPLHARATPTPAPQHPLAPHPPPAIQPAVSGARVPHGTDCHCVTCASNPQACCRGTQRAVIITHRAASPSPGLALTPPPPPPPPPSPIFYRMA